MTLISFFFLLIYALLQIPPYSLPAYMPDEFSFFQLATHYSQFFEIERPLRFIFHQQNTLGYGALYWMLFQTSLVLTPQDMISMRILGLLMMLSLPLLLLRRGMTLKAPYFLLTLLIWISFPISWWYGKIVGPEIFSLFISVTGLHLATSGSPLPKWKIPFGLFMLGVSLGIKLTVLPIATFAIFNLLGTFLGSKIPKKKILSAGLQWSLCLLFGFILANPFMIFEPSLFWENMEKVSSSPNYSWEHFQNIFTNNTWEWDLVRRGGLFQWSLNGLAFCSFIVFIFLAKIPKIPFLGFFVSFLLTIFLMLNSRGLSWYWFPFIFLIPTLILRAQNDSRSCKALLILCLFLNLSTSVSSIKESYQMKIEHYQNLLKGKTLPQCLVNLTSSRPRYDIIFNYSEIGFHYRFNFLLGPGGQTWQVYESSLVPMTIKSLQGQLDGKSRFLFLMGQRFKKIFYPNGPEQAFQQNILPQLGPRAVFAKLGQCGPIDIYEFFR